MKHISILIIPLDNIYTCIYIYGIIPIFLPTMHIATLAYSNVREMNDRHWNEWLEIIFFFHFVLSLGHQQAKIAPTWLKMKQFLNILSLRQGFIYPMAK